MDKVAMAVIGVGTMGSRHARIITANPNARLVAVAELDAGRRDAVSSSLGVPGYGDFRTMFDRHPEIDATTVCTPDGDHLEPTLLAIAHGTHVLVEKPIATTLQDAQHMAQAASAAGVKLMVGHILRFEPRHIQARAAIVAGQIGDPVHIVCRRNGTAEFGDFWRGRSTPLFQLAVHDVDVMHWLIGSRIVRVYAEGRTLHRDRPQGDDSVGAVVRFANGCFGLLEVSWLLPATLGRPDPRLHVVGSAGAVYVQLHDRGVQVYGAESAYYPDTVMMPIVRDHVSGALRDEIDDFVACVVDDRPPVVGADEGIAALKVVLALMDSLRAGQPVDVDQAGGPG